MNFVQPLVKEFQFYFLFFKFWSTETNELGKYVFQWVFTQAQAVWGGCLGCQPYHTFALGTVLPFILLHRGTPGYRTISLFYFEKEIELKYIQFPGILDWAFVWFCFMGLFSPSKILLCFNVNQTLFWRGQIFLLNAKCWLPMTYYLDLGCKPIFMFRDRFSICSSQSWSKGSDYQDLQK